MSPPTDADSESEEGTGYAQFIDPDDESDQASEEEEEEEEEDEEDVLRQRTSCLLTQKSHRFLSRSFSRLNVLCVAAILIIHHTYPMLQISMRSVNKQNSAYVSLG